MKFCKKCQTETDRYHSGECKPCGRARNAARYAANPEKVKAESAAWYRANPDRRKAANAVWQAANPEKVKASVSKWAKANPEKMKTIGAEWYTANSERAKARHTAWAKENPERVRAYSAEWRNANPQAVKTQWQNRRARKRNAEGSHTAEDIQRLLQLQKGMCVVCRRDLSPGYHVDHILPLVREGSNDWHNLQLLCPTCNLQKSAKHPIDFMQQKGFLL